MEIECLSGLEKVDPAEWNSIVERDRLICTYEFLRSVELSKINDCRYYYPVVREDGQIVAHACFYIISTQLDTFAQGLLKSTAEWIRRTCWPGFLMLKSIECGTPVALGNTISVRKDVNRTEAFALIVDAADQLARSLKLKMALFRDFEQADSWMSQVLLQRGYRLIHNLPGTRIHIRWSTFDEYLSSMRSQYRCKLMAQKRRFLAAEASLEVVSDFASYAPQMAALWKNAYDRAVEYRRELLGEDFFRHIKEWLGDRTEVILAKRGGKYVGFLLLFLDDDTVAPLFCGLDYSESRDSGTYFNLFYKALELAIERRFKFVDLGITTLAPKIDLGATPVPLFMYMKFDKPGLNCLVPGVFEMVTPFNRVPVHHVFKSNFPETVAQ